MVHQINILLNPIISIFLVEYLFKFNNTHYFRLILFLFFIIQSKFLFLFQYYKLKKFYNFSYKKIFEADFQRTWNFQILETAIKW